MPFNLIIPIWGESYLGFFGNWVGRTLLAHGNVPALAVKDPVVVTFLTRESDISILEKMAVVTGLRRHADVDFVPVDDIIETRHQFLILHHVYGRALAQPLRETSGDACFLLSADMLYADGAFSTAAARLNEGYRAVETTNPRLSNDSLERRLGSHHDDGEPLVLNARQLAALALSDLLPVEEALVWSNGRFIHTTAPHFYWRAGRDAMLVRSYLMHPFVVRRDKPVPEILGPVDYALLEQMKIPESEIYRPASSDEIFFIEVGSKAKEHEVLKAGVYTCEESAKALARWAVDLHWRNALHNFWILARDLDDTERRSLEQSASDTIDQIDRYRGRSAQPALSHPFWNSALARETDASTGQGQRALAGRLAAATRRLVRNPNGERTILHHRWLHRRLERNFIRRCTLNTDGTVLILTSRHEAADLVKATLPPDARVAVHIVAWEKEWFSRSVEQLPFPDRHFDVIVTIDALEAAYSLREAVNEVFRVLCMGGRLVGCIDRVPLGTEEALTRSGWSANELVRHLPQGAAGIDVAVASECGARGSLAAMDAAQRVLSRMIGGNIAGNVALFIPVLPLLFLFNVIGAAFQKVRPAGFGGTRYDATFLTCTKPAAGASAQG